jgi:UPF0755 protein
MTMEELVLQLQHGRLLPVNVTVPEGWRAEQIAQWLETQGVVVSADEFMAAVRQGRSDLQFLLDRPAGSSASLEGYLFPAKYQFDQRSDPHDVIGQMLAAWSSAWSDQIPEELRQKAAEQHRTIYEVLTLAALVEREAVASEERPVIAGVYMNRIAQGMYLQADPTVQYAKGFDPVTGRWWAPMEQEEAITVVSPYNTFLNPGLPPGPICNPGVASIRAALEPDVSGGYLFFYAMHDEGGHHAFARTYEEHLANEQLYGGGGGASQ